MKFLLPLLGVTSLSAPIVSAEVYSSTYLMEVNLNLDADSMWSGGEYWNETSRNIGNLNEKYESITWDRLKKEDYALKLTGYFKLQTGGTGGLTTEYLEVTLDKIVNDQERIVFEFKDEIDQSVVWANQISRIKTQVTINKNMDIEVYNYVYAYSTGSASTVYTVSNIKEFRLII